ncbi:unnamed protein product [Caenorhabditis brenneri]
MAEKQATLSTVPSVVHNAENHIENADQPSRIPVVKQELLNQDNEPDTPVNLLPTTQHAIIPNTGMWNHHYDGAPQYVNWNGFYQMQGAAPINPLTMGLQIPMAGVANNQIPVGIPVGPGNFGLQPLSAQQAQPQINMHHQNMNELFDGMSEVNKRQQLFYQKKIGELSEHIKQCDVFSKLQEQNFHQLQFSNQAQRNKLYEQNNLIFHLKDEIQKKDAQISNSVLRTGFEKEKREWIQEKAMLVKELSTLNQKRMDAENAQKQLEAEKKDEIAKLKKKHTDEIKVTRDNHKKVVEKMKADFKKQKIASQKKNTEHQKQMEDSLNNRDATNKEFKRWLQFRVSSNKGGNSSFCEICLRSEGFSDRYQFINLTNFSSQLFRRKHRGPSKQTPLEKLS